MGIRFLCATCGHKLNVKSFLAGKRGVCPQCGNGLDIPLESQITKSSSITKPVSVGASVDSARGKEAVPVRDPISTPAAADLPTSLPTVGAPEKAKKPLSRQAVTSVADASTNATTSDCSPLAVPMQPAQDRQSTQPATPVASPVEATPVEPAPVDPIDEAPNAIWYIRPASGGQYGPARGEIMRKWMGEGRVSADSLVWREGWDDWSTAADVFPSLGAGITPPVSAPAGPASFTAAATSPTSTSATIRPRRRNSAVLAVTVVSVLGLMCIALFVALILILMN
jgi:hypothetical protein